VPSPFAAVASAIDLDDRAVIHQPVHCCHRDYSVTVRKKDVSAADNAASANVAV